MKHVPNAITFMRLLMVPLFIFVYTSDMKNAHVYALIIFLTAGLSDMLDGYLARKYEVISVVGIILDPLADKVMLLTVLACFAKKGIIPSWSLAVMIIIEGILILSGIVLYFKKENYVVPAGKLGKAATVVFTVAVTMMFLIPDFLLTHLLFWTALAAKAASLVNYAKGFFTRNNLKKQN